MLCYPFVAPECGRSSCLEEKGGGSISSNSDILMLSCISVCCSTFPESRFFDHRLFCETLYFVSVFFRLTWWIFQVFIVNWNMLMLLLFTRCSLLFKKEACLKQWTGFFCVIQSVFYASQYRGYSWYWRKLSFSSKDVNSELVHAK